MTPSSRFGAIVYVIGILVDEKTSQFTNFRNVLDVYIRKHFRFDRVHVPLLQALVSSILPDCPPKAIIASLKVQLNTSKNSFITL